MNISELQEFFATDQFATGIGCRITGLVPCAQHVSSPEKPTLYEAHCVIEIKEKHLNGRGISMGGVAFTLGDFAMSVCGYANSCKVIGLNASITFLRPAKKGSILTAIAQPVKIGRTVCSFSVEIFSEDDILIATMNGQGLVKP